MIRDTDILQESRSACYQLRLGQDIAVKKEDKKKDETHLAEWEAASRKLIALNYHGIP